MWNSPREWRPEQPACRHSHDYLGHFELRRPGGTRHQLRGSESTVAVHPGMSFVFILSAGMVVDDA